MYNEDSNLKVHETEPGRFDNIINENDIEILYSIIRDLAEEETNHLINEILKYDQVAILIFLERISHASKYLFRDNDASNLEKIQRIMGKIFEESESFVIKLYVNIIKFQMLSSFQRWTSNDVVAYALTPPDLFSLINLQQNTEQQHNVHPRSALYRENKDLWKQVRPDNKTKRIRFMQRSSSDSIVALNGNFMPIGVSRLEGDPPQPSGIRYDKLLNIRKKLDMGLDVYAQQLLEYFINHIVPDLPKSDVQNLIEELFPDSQGQGSFFKLQEIVNKIYRIKIKMSKLEIENNTETILGHMGIFVKKGLEIIQKLDKPLLESIDANSFNTVKDQNADIKTRYNRIQEIIEILEPILETRRKLAKNDCQLYWELFSLMDDLNEKTGEFGGRKQTPSLRNWQRQKAKLDQLYNEESNNLGAVFSEGEEVFKTRLSGIINKLLDKQKRYNLHLNFKGIEEIIDEVIPLKLSINEREILAQLMKGFFIPDLRNYIQKTLNCDLSKLNLRSQVYFFYFLLNCDSQRWNDFHNIISKTTIDEEFKIQILGSFLATFDDKEFSEIIVYLAKNPLSREVFDQYSQLVKEIERSADEISRSQKDIGYKDIFYGLIKRGKDLLFEAYKILKTEKDLSKSKILLKNLLKNIKNERNEQSVIRSFFTTISQVLSKGQQIELKKLLKMQNSILKRFKDSETGNLLLKALHSNNGLAPVPEIHWRVDRTKDEYNRRFGFDIENFLDYFRNSKKQQVLLEFGPGNGTFKQKREKETAGYLDLALCDKLYYPLNNLIYEILNFKKLEKDADRLSEDEKKLICDFIYKILVIKKGQTEKDDFEYDQEIMAGLNDDPNNLIKYLLKKINLLTLVDKVPQTISTRDNQGNVKYPYKTGKPDKTAFNKACALLSANLAQYLAEPIETIDVYNYIPAYTPGIIIGDFENIKNLNNNQLDVALGVRSTVYIRDERYIHFMKDVVSKLNESGIYIDDNVRDNDGWYYRLAELKDVQKRIKRPVYVITGPGFRGEDFNQKNKVPLAVVISKSEDKLNYIKANLSEGFEIHKLDELTLNSEYLSSLDSSGHVLNSLSSSGYRLAS